MTIKMAVLWGGAGLLSGTAHFDDCCDASFVPPGATIEVLKFQDDESFCRAREKGLIR